jgi:hypothetical protein
MLNYGSTLLAPLAAINPVLPVLGFTVLLVVCLVLLVGLLLGLSLSKSKS